MKLKFCTHNHQLLPSNILYGFLKILIFRVKILKKKKKALKILFFFEIFKIFKIQDCSFVAILTLDPLGAQRAPCGFSQIAPEVLGISL